MIGPEVFSAIGYFTESPQQAVIERSVGMQLQRKLSKYKCQEQYHSTRNDIHEIEKTVVVMPLSYYRAFRDAAQGMTPTYNLDVIIERIQEQLEKV